MIQTMNCGLAEWECTLLDHIGCNVREVASTRPLIAITARIDTARPGIHPTVRRQEARDTKRTNEWIKSATQAAERRRTQPPVVRSRYERPTPLVTGELATEAMREVRVEPSMSIRNEARTALPKTRTIRVHEIAGRIERTPAETLQLLRSHGEYVRTVQSTVVWPAARDFILTQIGA